MISTGDMNRNGRFRQRFGRGGVTGGHGENLRDSIPSAPSARAGVKKAFIIRRLAGACALNPPARRGTIRAVVESEERAHGQGTDAQDQRGAQTQKGQGRQDREEVAVSRAAQKGAGYQLLGPAGRLRSGRARWRVRVPLAKALAP
jgi:hypothetical protein